MRRDILPAPSPCVSVDGSFRWRLFSYRRRVRNNVQFAASINHQRIKLASQRALPPGCGGIIIMPAFSAAGAGVATSRNRLLVRHAQNVTDEAGGVKSVVAA